MSYIEKCVLLTGGLEVSLSIYVAVDLDVKPQTKQMKELGVLKRKRRNNTDREGCQEH